MGVFLYMHAHAFTGSGSDHKPSTRVVSGGVVWAVVWGVVWAVMWEVVWGVVWAVVWEVLLGVVGGVVGGIVWVRSEWECDGTWTKFTQRNATADQARTDI